MHLKRWLTGLTAVPFLVFIICRGGLVFSVFVGAIALVGQWEYHRIVFAGPSQQTKAAIVRWAYLSLILLFWAAHVLSADMMLSVMVFHFALSATLAVFQFKRDPAALETLQKQVLGFVYIPFLLAHIVLIRDGSAQNGAVWIFFFLCVVFAGDIGALYCGTFWGRHKLCPSVSPKKTIEGSLGGIAANLIVGSAFKILFLNELPWLASLAFLVAAGVAGQLGDLFESAVKRAADVKDSGRLLPGHGGILDRADAAMFAAPVTYLFKEYLL